MNWIRHKGVRTNINAMVQCDNIGLHYDRYNKVIKIDSLNFSEVGSTVVMKAGSVKDDKILLIATNSLVVSSHWDKTYKIISSSKLSPQILLLLYIL